MTRLTTEWRGTSLAVSQILTEGWGNTPKGEGLGLERARSAGRFDRSLLVRSECHSDKERSREGSVHLQDCSRVWVSNFFACMGCTEQREVVLGQYFGCCRSDNTVLLAHQYFGCCCAVGVQLRLGRASLKERAAAMMALLAAPGHTGPAGCRLDACSRVSLKISNSYPFPPGIVALLELCPVPN